MVVPYFNKQYVSSCWNTERCRFLLFVCACCACWKMVLKASEDQCELWQVTVWISYHIPKLTVLYSLFTSEVYIHDKKVNHRSVAAALSQKLEAIKATNFKIYHYFRNLSGSSQIRLEE